MTSFPLLRVIPPARRPWVGLGGAALLWAVLYSQTQALADFISYDVLALDPASELGRALNFFAYDAPKILLLLTGMTFLITLARSFVTPEQMRALLGGKREGVGNVLAALFGVVTPFCSCSATPLFIGLVKAGVPLGVTFSYLIAAPMVNEVALILLFGMFGPEVAGVYLLSGLTLAIGSGYLLGRLKLERYVEPFVYAAPAPRTDILLLPVAPTWAERLQESAEETLSIVKKVAPFVLIGIAVGAFLHGYVPTDALVDVMGEGAWWSVPLAVLIGVPLYAGASGLLPIVSVLLEKGAALGTVLAFMMAVVGLSFPEFIILRRVLKPQLLAIFIGILSVGIVLTGYLFNLLWG